MLIEKIYVSEMFANEEGVYLSSVQNSEERRLIYQLTKNELIRTPRLKWLKN